MRELARRTEWQVIGLEPDADKAERSRKMLDAAGLAGRASIHQEALDTLPYTDICSTSSSASRCSPREHQGDQTEILHGAATQGGLAFFGIDDKTTYRRGPLDARANGRT